MSLGWPDRTAYIRRPAADFRSQKENVFPELVKSHTRYGDAAISNARNNARIRYGNLVHVGDWLRGQQLCI